MSLTHEYLLSRLSYEPETGIFRWLIKPRQRACSEIAGTVTYGYRQICINQKLYKAHRLAWFYIHKKWPEAQIDHINGNRGDNRIANLRLANFSENQANSKIRKGNRCGFKGVYLHKLSDLYMARITVKNKPMCLGYYKNPEDAHAAYLVAAKLHFGSFARGR